MIPVETKQALIDSYKQHRQVSSQVVLINCGATLDLVEVLEPSDDPNVVFYVIDSQRPLETRNVYNGMNVKIVVMPTELSAEEGLVPDYEQIFSDDEDKENEEEEEEEGEDEEEEDEDEDEEGTRSSSSSGKIRKRIMNNRSKRRKFDSEYLEKMHKKREWEQNRYIKNSK